MADHKYTIEQYSERLRELANAQDKVVAEEAKQAGILAGDDNFDAAAEHVQLAVEAKAQAESYKHAHRLLIQMGLVE